MVDWQVALIGAAAGAALVTIAEPVKAWLGRIPDASRAKREIYSELAEYIARVEYLRSDRANFGQVERLSPKKPTFESLDWYKSSQFDLLSRIDKQRGIRRLHNALLALYEKNAIRNEDSFDIPRKALNLIKYFEKDLHSKILGERLEVARKDEAYLLEEIGRKDRSS